MDYSPPSSTVHGISQARILTVKVKPLSRVRLIATLWSIAYQAFLSMGFSRQEYQKGLPFPSPRILKWVAISFSRWSSKPGIKPTSPALAGGFFITEPPGKSTLDRYLVVKLLGYVITLSLPSWETAKLFPKWLCHFSCSVVGNKCSNFSTFSLVTVCPLFV